MQARIELIAKLGRRFPGAHNANADDEKQRIGLLVQDTLSLPVDVLQIAISEGVKVWRYMPTAADIYEAAQDELRHRRDMARLAHVPPPAPALPSPAAPPPNDDQLAAMNEWGRALGLSWDANGKMTRVEPVKHGSKPLEERQAPTEHPKAADYAELRAAINAMAPPVSDVSPALKALRERMLGA